MRTTITILCFLCISAAACSSSNQGPGAETPTGGADQAATDPATAESGSDAALAALVADLPNGRTPEPGIATAGQPEEAAFAAVRDAGVRTVINMRAPSEVDFDEAATVEALGMNYVSIPITGAEDLNEANAQALDEALSGEGPFLVHCRTSNRVGAVFGVRAGLLQSMDADAAIDLARAHGMTDEYVPALQSILPGS